MVRKQESMADEEKLREFCKFSLVKRRQWSEQIAPDSYLLSSKDNRARLFPVMANDETRHSGHKLQRSDKMLTETYSLGGKHCIGKDTQIVAVSPSLEIFKTWLDKSTADLT